MHKQRRNFQEPWAPRGGIWVSNEMSKVPQRAPSLHFIESKIFAPSIADSGLVLKSRADLQTSGPCFGTKSIFL